MTRLVLVLLLLGSAALAQPNDIQKGKIAKIDLEKPSVTITSGGKDQEFLVVNETMVFGADPKKEPAERLKGFKAGTEVMFKAGMKDGKDILVGLKAAEAAKPEPPPPFDSSKLKPLTEFKDEKYQGYSGGLYPDGKNARPAEHEKAGLVLAKQVRPLNDDGQPQESGKIVMLSIGMSNTSQASEAFGQLLTKDKERNPRLIFVNGAQGGMTAKAIKDPHDGKSGTHYWKTVDERLKNARVMAAQVQVVWIKEADAGPSEGFPKYAESLSSELETIVQLLPKRFPNLKLAYVSSRTYGGFATTKLNPEPYAFESGFSVKWLIERQLKGEKSLNCDAAKGAVKAPWLSWGPYLWANGTTPRADGYFYEKDDYGPDGTHPTTRGAEKIAREMLKFFKDDSTTKPWFLKAN